MKRKKTPLILSVDFHFRFSIENEKMNVHFRFRFVFGLKLNFISVGIFDYGRKRKTVFGRLLVYILYTSQKGRGLEVQSCKVLVLVLNTRFGLSLERILKFWSCS